jgi:hypothetical protein
MPKRRRVGAKKTSDAMTFMNLTAGKWVSKAIAVAAELGIADLLKDGSKTAAQIARPANALEDVSIGCSALWGALGSLPRQETGDFASLRSANCFAPTRRKHSAPMRDS